MLNALGVGAGSHLPGGMSLDPEIGAAGVCLPGLLAHLCYQPTGEQYVSLRVTREVICVRLLRECVAINWK